MIADLDVRGGRRGVAAALDELWSVAGRLEALAEDLREVSRELARLLPGAVSRLGADCLAQGEAAAGAHVLAAVATVLGPRGPGAVGSSVAQTAAAVRLAVQGYQAVERGGALAGTQLAREAGASGLWMSAALVVGAVGGVAATDPGPAGRLARAWLGSRWGAGTVGALTASAPEAVAGAARLPVGSLGVPVLARATVLLAGTLGAFADGGVAADRPDRQAPRARPASGVADLLAETEKAARTRDEPGAPPPADRGTVRVTRVDHANGSRAWIVHVPGTQEWRPAPPSGASPFDLGADVRLVAAMPNDAEEAVGRAMADAGIAPGEPVLLVGHSQGGLVAASIAADPGMAAYDISHVVTAGSPTADIRVPDDVRVLSLEHSDDLVPRLDGAPNPDRENWVTVSTTAPPETRGPLPPHHSAAYVRTASAVDASPDPDLVAYRESLTPFLAAPGVTVAAHDTRFRRTDP